MAIKLPLQLLIECTYFSTPRQRFTFVHLFYPYLTVLVAQPFPNAQHHSLPRFFYGALYQSTFGRFEAPSCKTTSVVHLAIATTPPSQLQHATYILPSVASRHTMKRWGLLRANPPNLTEPKLLF